MKFSKATLSLFALSTFSYNESVVAISNGNAELDEATHLFSGPVEVVATDPTFQWLESPIWSDVGQYLLFSDVKWVRESDDISCGMIWKYEESTSNLTKLLECSGIAGPPGENQINGLPAGIDELAEAGSNGLYWEPAREGNTLIVNQHGWKRIVSINVDEIDESTASIDPEKVTVLIDSYNGTQLNSPNDMVISEKYGDLLFTDPPFGLQERNLADSFGDSFDHMTQDAPAVYVHNQTSGNVERVIQFDVPSEWSERYGPNGIAINERNGDLFVAITDFHNPRTEVYCMDDEDELDAREPCLTLHHEYRIEGPDSDDLPALTDGITYDGDLQVMFVAGPGGVYVYDTSVDSYDLLGFIRIDDLCANVGVGGGYLWMTCNKTLLRIPLAEGSAAVNINDEVGDQSMDDDASGAAGSSGLQSLFLASALVAIFSVL